MNNKKIKKFIATMIFLFVLSNIFVGVTYLLRGYSPERERVIGIKEEDKLDMIYIGGSAAFEFWQPLKAWHDYGFTSYNLGTSSIQAENIKYYIKYALKYQKPELFVIGIRSFQYYNSKLFDAQSEGGLRHASDSLDLGIDRIKLVRTYMKNHVVPDNVDRMSFYNDIVKYHTNYLALSDPISWKMITNTGTSKSKGYLMYPLYHYLQENHNFKSGGVYHARQKWFKCFI